MQTENNKKDAPLTDKSVKNKRDITLLVNEVQLLLAEKRTSLSVLRTGIAVFAIPISALSILIATSKYYNPGKVLHLLIPVLLICLGLVVLAIYLIVRAVKKLQAAEHLINELKGRSKDIADLIT
jgi:uncharacterized membrane protein YidH (DUF202 family)